MKVDRRRALFGGLGAIAAAAAAPLFGRSAPAAQSEPKPDTYIMPKPEEVEVYEPPKRRSAIVESDRCLNVTKEMNDLLRRCGDQNYRVSDPAVGDLVCALQIPFQKGIIEKTSVGNLHVPAGVRLKVVEISECVEIRKKFARDCRWDILARACEVFENKLAEKISEAAQDGDYMVNGLNIWSDATLHKKDMFGWFAWIELGQTV